MGHAYWCLLGLTLSTSAPPTNPGAPEAVIAFAKALAQVRYTHPSDEACRAPWSKLSETGLAHFSRLRPDQDVQGELQRFFTPWAPSIQFLPLGQSPVCPSVPEGTHYLVRFTKGRNHLSRKREYTPFGERPPKGWVDPQGNQGQALNKTIQMLCPTVCFANKAHQTLPHAPAAPLHCIPPRKTDPTQALLLKSWGILWLFHPSTRTVNWDAQLIMALSSGSTRPFLEQFQHMVAPLQDESLKCKPRIPSPAQNVTCWRLSGAYTLQWKPVN